MAVERARKDAEEAAAAKREAEERLREREKNARKPKSPPPPPPATTAATPQSTTRSATADPAEAEFEAHLLKIEVIWNSAQTKNSLSNLMFSSRVLRMRLGKRPVLS